MSIGIYDADMHNYLLVPFNLTAMKLSAYYKSKRDIVVLTKNFTPERNKNYIYVKDWDDGIYESSNMTNIMYYGHAFSGPQYVPLDEEIESMRPDISLYSTMEKEIIGNGTAKRRKIFNNMVQCEHCRLSLDNNSIWGNYDSQFSNIEKCTNIMFHDWDLGQITNSFETIQNILSVARKNPQIGMKFPVQLYEFNDLMKWSSLNANSTFFSVRYNGIMTTPQFVSWIANNFTNKQIYIEYYVTPNTVSEVDFIYKYLYILFQQIVISRSYKLKISLIYNEDFFKNKQWARLLDLFNYYEHSMLSAISDSKFINEVQHDTLYDFAKKSLNTYGKYPKMLTKQEIRELFHLVGDYVPELFRAFYELNTIEISKQGGFQ